MYQVEKMPNLINIGFVGEKNFRTIEIDMSAWMAEMPDGVPSIVHIQPGQTEEDAYVVNTAFDDNILSWTVSAGDLGSVDGIGSAQVWLEEEENSSVVKRGKSVVFSTQIGKSLGEPSGTVPEAQESWLETMTELKTLTVNAKTDAVSAKNDAVNAKGDAQAAKTAAETAQGKAEAAQTDAEAAKAAAEAAIAKYPYVDVSTGNWMVWNPSTEAWVNTGVHAKGDTGAVPNIAIGDVTTLNPDQPATVTRRSGSPDTAPIFDFGLPKGEAGSIDNVYGSTIPMSSTDSTKVKDAIDGKIDDPLTAGTDGQVLTSDGLGGASWQTPSGGTVTDVQEDGTSILHDGVANILTMTGAGSSAAGSKGLVPAPAAGDNEKWLCGDGNWKVVPGTKPIIVDLDNVSNTSGSYSHDTTISGVTSDMRATAIWLGTPATFNDKISVTTSNGKVTLSCNDVAGTSTVKVKLELIATPSTITSTEFDTLANRIGTLANLATTVKTDLVNAVNEVKSGVTTNNQAIANLNSFGSNYEVGSLSALDTQMNAFLAMMADGENRLFRIKATASFGCFGINAAYFVEMKKSSATYSSAFIQCVGGATAIIATKDTNGWSYLELTGSAISAAQYDSVNNRVIKSGNVCQIVCTTGTWYCGASEAIRQGSASGTQWIIPAGFRPIAQTEIREALNGKRIIINPDGSVTCNEALSGAALRFGGCYIANV